MEKEKGKEQSSELSRREFLRDAGVCAGCAAVGGAALLSSCSGKTTTETATVTAPGKTVTVTGAGATSTVTTTVTATGAATSKLTLMEPTGKFAHNVTWLYAPRLDTLDGKTIALMDWAPFKWQGYRVLPYVFEKIKAKYPTVKFLPREEFTPGTNVDTPENAAKAKQMGANAMISAYGAWGSCARACGGIAAECEKIGIPSCSLDRFDFYGPALTGWMSRGGPPEMPGINPGQLPPVGLSGNLQMVESDLTELDPHIDEIIGCLVKGLPKSWAPKGTWKLGTLQIEPPTYTVSGTDFDDLYDSFQNLYYQKWIGDGWPCAPATRKRVDWILTGTDKKASDIVGADEKLTGVLQNSRRVCTYDLMATGMAMAGGRPEYMCVAEADLKTRIEKNAGYESTGNSVPVILASGPITNEIRLNNGTHLFGVNVKFPAGQLISRANWLVYQNVGAQCPGLGTTGVYGKFRPGPCFAECEGGVPNGWTTFAEEYYKRAKGTNSVTYGSGGDCLTLNVRGEYNDPVINSIQDAIDDIACTIRTVTTDIPADAAGSGKMMIITPLTARFFDKYGWNKQRLMKEWAAGAFFTYEDIKSLKATQWSFQKAKLDPNSINPLTHFACYTDPTKLYVICAGLDHMRGNVLTWSPSGNRLVTKPASWQTLLNDAIKDLGPIPAYGVGGNNTGAYVPS